MNKLFLVAIGAFILFAGIFFAGKYSSDAVLLDSNLFTNKYKEVPSSVIIDVRTPSEFSNGHIAKAINIDFQNPNFETEIKKLDPSGNYFVYCQSGNRSGQAVRKMQSLGIKNIFELRGGLNSDLSLIEQSSRSSN